MNYGFPARMSGGRTKCFSIEDLKMRGMRPRRLGGLSRSELMVVGPARLIVDPLGYSFGRGRREK